MFVEQVFERKLRLRPPFAAPAVSYDRGLLIRDRLLYLAVYPVMRYVYRTLYMSLAKFFGSPDVYQDRAAFLLP